MSLAKPNQHKQQPYSSQAMLDIRQPLSPIAVATIKDSQVAVFTDGIHVVERGGSGYRRQELTHFLAVKHISKINWGFMPNIPAIITFFVMCVIACGFIGFFIDGNNHFGGGRIGVGGLGGGFLGIFLAAFLIGFFINNFRIFVLNITCDSQNVTLAGGVQFQAEMIRIVEAWRGLKYGELTGQNGANTTPAPKKTGSYPNVPPQTGYPNPPKG